MFPTGDGPVVRTVDDFEQPWCSMFFDGLDCTMQAIADVAAERRNPLRRLYALQHVGLDELGPHPFSTTYEQLHWHVYGITPTLLEQCTYGEFPHRADRCLKFTFREPLLRIYSDIFSSTFQDAREDGLTGSIVIASGPLALTTPEPMRRRIAAAMGVWKGVWRAIASCFTDFLSDAGGRLVPIAPEDRQQRVLTLVNRYALSRRSQRILEWCARNVR